LHRWPVRNIVLAVTLILAAMVIVVALTVGYLTGTL
jgi:hypothetical protein